MISQICKQDIVDFLIFAISPFSFVTVDILLLYKGIYFCELFPQTEGDLPPEN